MDVGVVNMDVSVVNRKSLKVKYHSNVFQDY